MVSSGIISDTPFISWLSFPNISLKSLAEKLLPIKLGIALTMTVLFPNASASKPSFLIYGASSLNFCISSSVSSTVKGLNSPWLKRGFRVYTVFLFFRTLSFHGRHADLSRNRSSPSSRIIYVSKACPTISAFISLSRSSCTCGTGTTAAGCIASVAFFCSRGGLHPGSLLFSLPFLL